MTIRLDRLLSVEEYQAATDDAVARGFYRNDRRVFLPGMGWHNKWYLRMHKDFLSPHYWRDWADKRPPIELVCPNGEVWCIDRRSSNGDGWQVQGEWPNITCSPSIVAGDYHGFLRNGEFTPDLDGKTWPVPNVPADYVKADA
jgi:hypothetical protein